MEKSRGVAGCLKKATRNLGVRSRKESGKDYGRDARAGEADRIPAMRDPDSDRGFQKEGRGWVGVHSARMGRRVEWGQQQERARSGGGPRSRGRGARKKEGLMCGPWLSVGHGLTRGERA